MPRRIIYLRNPSEGSHFRVLGGSASTRPPRTKRTPKPRALPVPKPEDRNPNGYMPGYKTPTTWFVHHDSPGSPDFGSYDGPGTGPWDQPFTEFEQASTDLGFLYDMLIRGIDPFTGNILPPLGTEGTMKFGAGTGWTDFQDQMEAAGIFQGNTTLVGYISPSAAHTGNPWPEIPSGLRAKSPKRNEPRPWWAK